MDKQIVFVLMAVFSTIAMTSSPARAQTQHAPVTRAQVQCELRAREGAGYRPWQEDFYYPQNLQAAQARLAQQNKARGLPPEGACGDAENSQRTAPGSGM
jgi:hypothetical protein